MKYKIQWDKVGLGLKSDAKLASELGVSYYTVYRHRHKMNIKGQSKIKHDIDWTKIKLGTKPDSEIAKEIGCSTTLVMKYRNKLKIKPFIGIFLNQEGNYCRSIYEAMYDAYLHWKNIKHVHEIKIKDLPYIADFKVNDIYVEIFGMKRYPGYNKRMDKKINDYIQNNINFKEITIKEIENLYKNCPININCRVERKCKKCHKDVLHFYKEMCRSCYRANYGKTINCKYCKISFLSKDYEKKFCSTACYAKSLLKINWPEEEWFIDKIEKKTSREEIAKILSTNCQNLSCYLHRLRQKSKNPEKLKFSRGFI